MLTQRDAAASEHPFNGLVQVKYLGGDGLLTGKGQQLPGEVSETLGGFLNLRVGRQTAAGLDPTLSMAIPRVA